MRTLRQWGSFTVALAVISIASPAGALETPDDELDQLASLASNGPDRAGLRRDTWYFLGYQWVTIGLLYIGPESVSGWTEEQKEGYNMSYWWDNVKNIHWDGDKLYINYVMHPYFGGAYYVRARERGYDDRQAFWYSAMLSSMYEFGAEALFERVSIQDLIVTPVAGTLVGRYFMNVRDDIRKRESELGYRRTRDKWLWALTDPLGALNRQVDRLFGRALTVELRPYRYLPRTSDHGPFTTIHDDADPVYGLQLHVEF